MKKCVSERITPFLFMAAGLSVSACGPRSGAVGPESRPNVIFIICDDLNDYQGAFEGHRQAKTPNIDKLAASGIAFVNAHTNCPVCSPSRNSLFTGVYPHKSGDFGWTPHFKMPSLQHNKTIMELFAENGYHVMGSGKLMHVRHRPSWHEWGVEINNYGPLAFNGVQPVGHPSVPEPFRSIGPIDGSFAPLSDVPVFDDSISGGNQTGWIYNRGENTFLNYVSDDNRDLMPDEMHAQWAKKRIREMDDAGEKKPFFMGIGFVRPHTPLYAPKKYFDMFPLDEIELPEILPGDAEDTWYKDLYPQDIKGLRYYRTLKESYGGDAELGLKHFLQAYLACVAFVDEQIGVVMDALENSSFRENTIVVLTSDHGWQMGEKEYLFKNSPWEESTRVPLIIRAPNAKSGKKVDHPVSLIDLYPTLRDVCGLDGDNRKNDAGSLTDGHSLKPFLKKPGLKKWDGPAGALTMIGVGIDEKDAARQTYAYRTRDWRYILYLDGSEELYDKRRDPLEWVNLAADEKFAQQKSGLRKELESLLKK